MSRKAWLLVLTAIGVAILFALGWWQKERLEWKRAYLAEVEQAVTADPVGSLAQIEWLQDSGVPLDYRRVSLRVEAIEGAPVYRVFRGRGLVWEVFTPVRAEDVSVFAGLGEIADDAPVSADVPDVLRGYVRAYDADDLRGGTSSPDGNRYYRFNQDFQWRPESEPFATLYIDHDPSIPLGGPIPVKRPDIPNNHFQYMLTWWSFAIILIVISTILYRREA